MRSHSAIPAPPRPFRKTPGWRQRKFTGVTIIITIIGGIVGTITIGIVGIITVITTTIIITATGTAGECDSLAQMPNRPASSRA
ncbi:hypothetical protein J6524_28140 [Bradyrhizobium sp. WSM 1738]|uniref:hypothetical protein n=1 Tax=Bradyrhizobium hereditatis TaxID=2821405 RepID=UPI002896324E|nr:hypothetical protein [Bradyrhizobium hereditatis]MCA6118720.1 hypothetical protein [Bradyrhizobium hereditatis]